MHRFLLPRQAVAMGRFSSLDPVLDCMYGDYPPIHFILETVQEDLFLTAEYEGVIVISIRLLRREIARTPFILLASR